METPLSVPQTLPPLDPYQANDGRTLWYRSSPPLDSVGPQESKRCILLIHGFSGSTEYFKRNYEALSDSGKNWVVAIELRGHGRLAKLTGKGGGFHVARLAMDLRNLIDELRSHTEDPDNFRVAGVGCSLGAAVLLTYVELFTDRDFSGLVLVDQAPLQDRAPLFGWDETKAHKSLYDEATMLAAQRAWMENQHEAARGLVAECLGYRNQPLDVDNVSAEQAAEDEKFFVDISMQCDGRWLARLIADHTRYDHREALEMVTVPTLVVIGKRSGCFTAAGLRENAERVSGEARILEFDSGHWMFWEEHEKFNAALLGFTKEVWNAADSPSTM
ncbi:Alpha/Beta hydrolase protein [Echria macrotheca]|uniref:Alpha/Beta hydrolase protein n=1 Tax=Echria macrotheca TaxID=438768 RepID=A0AAJ0BEK5_9PEZI|nr:Alpha/Beta hydrolase protein [Echria macrotheca]